MIHIHMLLVTLDFVLCCLNTVHTDVTGRIALNYSCVTLVAIKFNFV